MGESFSDRDGLRAFADQETRACARYHAAFAADVIGIYDQMMEEMDQLRILIQSKYPKASFELGQDKDFSGIFYFVIYPGENRREIYDLVVKDDKWKFWGIGKFGWKPMFPDHIK